MEKKIITPALTLLLVAFIAASVFAYYPFQLLIQPTSPPVIFEKGKNADQSDLGNSKTIGVSLGANKTSVTVTIHPTYRTTYYKNVTLLINSDGKAHNVYLILDSRNSTLPSGSKVWFIVFSKGATRDLPANYPEPGTPSGAVKVIELTNTNTNDPVNIGSLSSNGIWEIDFMVYIPEGYVMGSATFSMHIAYTPSTETPP